MKYKLNLFLKNQYFLLLLNHTNQYLEMITKQMDISFTCLIVFQENYIVFCCRRGEKNISIFNYHKVILISVEYDHTYIQRYTNLFVLLYKILMRMNILIYLLNYFIALIKFNNY